MDLFLTHTLTILAQCFPVFPWHSSPSRAQAASLFTFPDTHTQPVRLTGPHTDHYIHNTQQTQETKSIHTRSGIQTALPANQLSPTYALNLTATEIGSIWSYCALYAANSYKIHIHTVHDDIIKVFLFTN
jgi:hypothetical protein